MRIQPPPPQHRWEDSGRKKGFGYIEFNDEEAADAACGIHKILGVMLEVGNFHCDCHDVINVLIFLIVVIILISSSS